MARNIMNHLISTLQKKTAGKRWGSGVHMYSGLPDRHTMALVALCFRSRIHGQLLKEDSAVERGRCRVGPARRMDGLLDDDGGRQVLLEVTARDPENGQSRRGDCCGEERVRRFHVALP